MRRSALNVDVEMTEGRARAIVTVLGRRPLQGAVVNIIAAADHLLEPSGTGRLLVDANNAHFEGPVDAAIWERTMYPGTVYVFDAHLSAPSALVVDVNGWNGRRTIQTSKGVTLT